MAMIRANVEEDRETTMARFLQGLNPDIRDRVELQHYVELEDMVHMAILVDQQSKRRSGARGYGVGSTSWKPNYGKREEKTVAKTKFGQKQATPSQETQPKPDSLSSRNRDIKCFKCQGRGHIASQCPNKRVMVLNAQGDIEMEDEEDEEVDDDMPPLEDVDDGEHAVEGETLVARRALSLQIKEETNNQRENLFHTHCFVNNKVCSVIIDGEELYECGKHRVGREVGIDDPKEPTTLSSTVAERIWRSQGD